MGDRERYQEVCCSRHIIGEREKPHARRQGYRLLKRNSCQRSSTPTGGGARA